MSTGAHPSSAGEQRQGVRIQEVLSDVLLLWGIGNDFFVVLTVFLFSSLAPVVASEVGFVLGRRRKSDVDPDGHSEISKVEGALLALLVDLGYPRHGLVRVAPESMIRARESLK